MTSKSHCPERDLKWHVNYLISPRKFQHLQFSRTLQKKNNRQSQNLLKIIEKNAENKKNYVQKKKGRAQIKYKQKLISNQYKMFDFKRSGCFNQTLVRHVV